MDGVPFTVEILLDGKIVGSVYNFVSQPNSQGGLVGCENCAKQERSKQLCSGQVSLTSALISSINDTGLNLTTLDKNAVVPYLEKHLTSRVLLVRMLPLALLLSRHRTAHVNIVYRMVASKSHRWRSRQ